MFRQKTYTLFLTFSCNFVASSKQCFPTLHIVDLQYKYISAYNAKYFRFIWCHKAVGSNKIICFPTGKHHIFVILFRYSSFSNLCQDAAFERRRVRRLPWFGAAQCTLLIIFLSVIRKILDISQAIGHETAARIIK
jgi:hypothetical protein